MNGKKVIQILIAENIPSLNKGEETILDGMLESFKVLGEAQVSMFSKIPEIDQPRYLNKVRVIDIKAFWPVGKKIFLSGVGKILISVSIMIQHFLFIVLYKIYGSKVLGVMRSQLWKEYLQADLIIVGHNGAFGWGGGWNPIVFYPIYLPYFARQINKPIVLYAGSFYKPIKFAMLFDRIFKFSLSNMNLITLRESISFNNIKKIWPHSNNAFLTLDIAFLSQPAGTERIQEILVSEGIDKTNGPLIGMTIVAKAIANHFEIISQAIGHLAENYNAQIVFVPHCIGYGKNLDDRVPAMEIYHQSCHKKNIKVITNEYNASELKGLLGQCDLVIGERVHSVINATSMSVPSIIMSMSSDSRLDIFRVIGLDRAIYYLEELSAASLIKKIDLIMSQKSKIRQDLKEKQALIKEKVMCNSSLLLKILNS